ncbi:uncharacterized protein BYT42DRAFT_586948 [Radiomyces spectabilis]|uniref:uncharacterized protein n=1 Tax=Radiomyces spectabilis TaxID=64574 RepID=UPI00221F349F|nr:uncharacterized protein BYT42DRAFT_586948 [Radiomyces spectabilis]KAI8367637.1 hypothetical protein BYT42DRAFT_586948 [Radiomyces spectabilis]
MPEAGRVFCTTKRIMLRVRTVLPAVRRSFFSKRGAAFNVKVDSDGLPKQPTWSVHSLVSSISEDAGTISNEHFDHLFRLAQLRAPVDPETRSKLKKDVDQLSQFTQHIQTADFGHVEPLTHIWPETEGLTLREDVCEASDQIRGRALMEKAKHTSGNFYAVRGSLPSSD